MFDIHLIRQKINDAYQYLSESIQKDEYELVIYLGSGFDPVSEIFSVHKEIPFSEIPGFPQSTVIGHKGQLALSSFNGRNILLMRGRFHFYEGYSMQELSLPIRVFNKIGLKKIILTNAAGGIHPNFRAGELVIIEDHINGSNFNPLTGPNLEEFGPRFPDMTETYDRRMIGTAESVMERLGLKSQKGVYYYTPGPSFETPTEIKMMAKLGADLVGMSTVPEALVAKHCGFKIFGLSFVTNKAAGLGNEYLDHEKVLDTFKGKAEMVKQFFSSFLKNIFSGQVI